MSEKISNIATLLAHIPALNKELQDAILKDFSIELEKVRIRKGKFLFTQENLTDDMYFIIEGLLQVSIKLEDGIENDIAKLGPGETIGEIGFLIRGKRSVHVRAIQDTQLLKLSRKVFERISDKYPEVFQIMVGIIEERLKQNQMLSCLPKLFRTLDKTMFRDIESHIEWVHLHGNQFLFKHGDDAENIYILVSGHLRAVVEDKEGNEKVLNEIERGEIIGEIALITGEPRSASVYAVRDSKLIKCSNKNFYEQIIKKHPLVLKDISKTLIKRLRQSEETLPMSSKIINIAVVSVGSNTRLTDFANRLSDALSHLNSTLYLSSHRINSLLGVKDIANTSPYDPRDIWLTTWLNEQEAEHVFIIYEADTTTSPWTRRCIRQADQILLLADATSNPELNEIEKSLLSPQNSTTKARRTLILVHPNEIKIPTRTMDWLSVHQVEHHYHIRWDTRTDFSRLARILSGRAVGLVLGGGGARGFAHIGVIRALEEANIPIDMVGGTSIGAIISAWYAMGFDYETIVRLSRNLIVESKPFRDFTLPLISIIKGHKFDRIVKEQIGDIRIEDLWTSYFCVSCNLTTSSVLINRYGLLWKAIRSSCSIPGIFAPLLDNNCLLVDGGIVNNLPGDVMRNFKAETVIVVDVSLKKDLTFDQKMFPSPWKVLAELILPNKKKIKVPNIINIMMRSIEVNSIQQAKSIKMNADIYLEPPIEKFGVLQFEAIDEIIDAGYQYTKRKIEGLKNAGALKKIT